MVQKGKIADIIRSQDRVGLESELHRAYHVSMRTLYILRIYPVILKHEHSKQHDQEVTDLRSKILISSWGGRRNAPTAFTESGLYMLATILKSEQATQTTIAIIDTFVQLRELARTMQAVTATDDETQKKTLMQRSGELIGEVLGSQLDTTETETEIELNFAVIKIKHKVKKGKK